MKNQFCCPKIARGTLLLILGAFGGIDYIARAVGGELDTGIGYAWEHSNNILRVSNNEQGESVHTLTAGLGYLETNPEFSARALLQAEYRDYQRNLLSDETVFTANASGTWRIIPQRFTWNAEDAYRQLLLNITQPDVPTNRVNTNIFSTGPDFTVPLSTVDSLALGARYANMNVSDSTLDNERYTARAGWRHMVSPTTELSLNHTVAQVNYADDVANPNYRSESSFFHYQTRPTQSMYLLDYGVTKAQRNGGNELQSRLVRLGWTRQSTPEITMGATYSEEFQDTGSMLLDTVTGVPDPAAPSTPTTAAAPTGRAPRRGSS